MSHSWDPMLEALRRRFEEDILPTIQAQTKSPSKWRRTLWSALFHLRHRWLDFLFLGAAVIPLVVAAYLLATSYPWSAAKGAEDYAGVVVTAATTTAFGGVLFGLVATPLQAAAELAAGYSAELLQRRTLWLTGAWLVTLAIGLFLLGAMRPDQEVAIASGLLTGSSLALVWASARSLLASSDPQVVARRVANFIKGGMNSSRAYVRRFVRESLPKELRDEPPGLLLIRQEERRIINGFLRHFKAGIEGALAHRQPTSAIVLWDAALEAFLDYSKEVGGDVGDSQGLTETLLSMVDEMVQQGLSIPLDDAAVHPIVSLEKLFAFEAESDSYSVVRSVALIKLKNWIQAGWSDDNTRVPASAVEAIGQLLRHAVRTGAHEDAIHAMSALHEIGAQSVAERRTHISKTAMQELVTALSAFLAADSEDLRNYLVSRWAQDARQLSRLRLLEANVFFIRATEAIFPGITLWGKGLQEVIALLGPYAHLSSQVVQPLANWLQVALQDFGARKENQVHYFAIEALALLYCLGLTQAHAVAAGEPPRTNEVARIVDVLLRWVAWLPAEDVGEILLDPDIDEMVWSVLLAAAYAADEPELLTKSADPILNRLTDRLAQDTPVHDTFTSEFVTGLMVATSRPEEEIAEVIERLVERRRWGSTYRGIYIDGLGRVPSANRNRAAIADPQLYEVINSWAAEKFPGFVSVRRTKSAVESSHPDEQTEGES